MEDWTVLTVRIRIVVLLDYPLDDQRHVGKMIIEGQSSSVRAGIAHRSADEDVDRLIRSHHLCTLLSFRGTTTTEDTLARFCKHFRTYRVPYPDVSLARHHHTLRCGSSMSKPNSDLALNDGDEAYIKRQYPLIVDHLI